MSKILLGIKNTDIYESLCFDDVLLRPRRSAIDSRRGINLDTALGYMEGRIINLKKPLISSPMDTVTDSEMAINMALNGGLGIIHRFMSVDEQVSEVNRVKRYVNYIFTEPYTVQDTMTIAEVIKQANEKHITTFCVMNDNNRLVGIVTRRDFQYYLDAIDTSVFNNNVVEVVEVEGGKLVSTIMTQIMEMHKITVLNKSMHDVKTDPNYLESIMNIANNMLNLYKIEKVPIVAHYRHEDYVYGDVLDQSVPTGELLGLITRRSVEFYKKHRQNACLDSKGRLCVGASVGIKPGFMDNATKLIEAGVDLLCVDVANGHNTHTHDAVRELRDKFPNIVIMAGNVVTAEGYRDMVEAGADCIRIGIGNGSICTTRLETGVGFGQFTAIREIYQYRLNMLCEMSKGALPTLISDGGSLGKTGNKVKALAAGADAIMLGRSLASCEESPGKIIIKDGKRMKYYRGMASTMASLSSQERTTKLGSTPVEYTDMDMLTLPTKRSKRQDIRASEGVDGLVEIQCSVSEKLASIVAGIRSGLSYLGVTSMDELELLRQIPAGNKGCIEWAKSTTIGQRETGIRIGRL